MAPPLAQWARFCLSRPNTREMKPNGHCTSLSLRNGPYRYLQALIKLLYLFFSRSIKEETEWGCRLTGVERPRGMAVCRKADESG